MTSFPEKVWDGFTSEELWQKLVSRPPLQEPQYCRLVQELQAVQRMLLEHNTSIQVLLANVSASKAGWCACPGSTGNYSVTGLGFKPKCVMFFVSKNPGQSAAFRLCQGVMDHYGNQWSVTWATDGSTQSDSKRDMAIYTLNASGVLQVAASYVSMDDDGFTLNFTNVNANYDIHWKATA